MIGLSRTETRTMAIPPLPSSRLPRRHRLTLPGLLALSLAACQGTAAVDGLRFRVIGTEPFWGLEVEGDRLVWSDPAHPHGRAFSARPRQGSGGMVWEGRLDGEPARLELVRRACSDGMSDRHHPYAARWEWGGRTLAGCAWVPED